MNGGAISFRSEGTPLCGAHSEPSGPSLVSVHIRSALQTAYVWSTDQMFQ